jgi:phytoene desaturase
LTAGAGRQTFFVVNADAAMFRGRVFRRPAFSDEKLDRMQWTLAPLTIYLGVKGKMENIHHHNYFLGDRDYEPYSKGSSGTSLT